MANTGSTNNNTTKTNDDIVDTHNIEFSTHSNSDRNENQQPSPNHTTNSNHEIHIIMDTPTSKTSKTDNPQNNKDTFNLKLKNQPTKKRPSSTLLSSDSDDSLQKHNMAGKKQKTTINSTNIQPTHNTPSTSYETRYPPLPKYNVHTTNSFAELSDESDMEEENNNIGNVENQQQSQVQNKTTIKRALPPLIAYNINNKNATTAIKDLINHTNFNIKVLNNKNYKITHIITYDISDRKKIQQYLIDAQIEHYTYTPKDSKPNNLILKGIDIAFTNDEIIGDLKTLHPKLDYTSLKINNFNNFNKNNSNLRLVQISKKDDIKEILKTKFILHQRAYWERLKPSEHTQCHRCLRFNHATQNCHMPYRCVKCLNDHQPGMCTRPTDLSIMSTEEKQQVACVNCNQFGHPANYRHCPYYVQLIKRLQQKKIDSQQRKQTLYNNFVIPNISYANATRAQHPHTNSQVEPNINSNNYIRNNNTVTHTYNTNNSNSPTPLINNNTNNLNFLQAECLNLFGTELNNILTKINNFVENYKTISDTHVKKNALLTFLFELSSVSSSLPSP